MNRLRPKVTILTLNLKGDTYHYIYNRDDVSKIAISMYIDKHAKDPELNITNYWRLKLLEELFKPEKGST